MRKIILLIMILFATLALTSQSVFDFGIRGGFNNSKITTNVKSIVHNTLEGYQMGLFCRVGGKSHLQPEVFIASRGGALDIQYDNGLMVTKNIMLNTVEIPLLVGYKLINLRNFNMRVQAGPSVSFIIDKEVYFTEELDLPDYQTIENEMLDELWGFKVGAGLDIFFITFDVRYEIGLNNFYNSAVQSSFNINRYHNNVFLMSLGIKLLSI